MTCSDEAAPAAGRAAGQVTGLWAEAEADGGEEGEEDAAEADEDEDEEVEEEEEEEVCGDGAAGGGGLLTGGSSAVSSHAPSSFNVQVRHATLTLQPYLSSLQPCFEPPSTLSPALNLEGRV